jgi:hypothetical protein
MPEEFVNSPLQFSTTMLNSTQLPVHPVSLRPNQPAYIVGILLATGESIHTRHMPIRLRTSPSVTTAELLLRIIL